MWLESLCSFTDGGRGGPELSWNDLWGVVWPECQSLDKLFGWSVAKASVLLSVLTPQGWAACFQRLCSAKGSHPS